jgi:hypothetical protein
MNLDTFKLLDLPWRADIMLVLEDGAHQLDMETF